MVGVVSDQLCADYKSAPAMTHAERCEGVRHCRWADEILPDAPWVVDQAWMEKHDIDYIAHDELVYPSKGHEDVYAFAKSQGKSMQTSHDILLKDLRSFRTYATYPCDINLGPTRTDSPRLPRWILRFQAGEERSSRADCCGCRLGFECKSRETGEEK
jgi:glycerol-3-phosphate cytidylyltransferase-like family protein